MRTIVFGLMLLVLVGARGAQEQGPATCDGPYGEAPLLRLAAVMPGKRILFLLPKCGVKVDWSADLEAQLKGALRGNPELAPVTVEEVLREMRRLAGGRKAGETRVNPKDGLTYVWIPPGRFRIGCSAGDTECDSDEKPARDVEIEKGFWLGESEVTQGAYERVIGKKPSHFQGAKKPVENVSWEEAKRYCESVGGRLPREAEWEYAARGGTTGARYGELAEIGWYSKNSGGETHEVKGKAPNGFGLYDVIGNVWEWVDDWYDGGWYGKARGIEGPPSGTYKVLRGGSWFDGPGYARASSRDLLQPEEALLVGFRCAGDSL